jgi:hypothetical protein
MPMVEVKELPTHKSKERHVQWSADKADLHASGVE